MSQLRLTAWDRADWSCPRCLCSNFALVMYELTKLSMLISWALRDITSVFSSLSPLMPVESETHKRICHCLLCWRFARCPRRHKLPLSSKIQRRMQGTYCCIVMNGGNSVGGVPQFLPLDYTYMLLYIIYLFCIPDQINQTVCYLFEALSKLFSYTPPQ